MELFVFTLIAAITSRRWLRHREAASGWLAAMFGILAGFLGLAQLLSAPPYSPLMLVVVKVFLAVLLLFPYCLYRFMATFGRPCRLVSGISHALLAGVLLVTVSIPRFPLPTERRSGLLVFYGALIVVEWVFLSAVVVIRLWRAGVGLPTVARRRSQMLASGAAVLAVNVVVSGLTPSHTQASVTNIVLETISVLGALLFLFGFRPPHSLLRRWRRGDDDKLKEAMVGLVQATASHDVVHRLLPRIAELVGAEGATLLDAEGELLGQCGRTDGDARAPGGTRRPAPKRQEIASGVTQLGDHLRVELPQGSLHIWSTPYTPFFGREQLDLLQSLGSLLHLTLDRTLAQEREAQAAADLAEAQQIAHLGSWRWEPATSVVRWSPEMCRLYGQDPAVEVRTIGSYDAGTHPDDVELAADAIREAVTSGNELDKEWRIVTRDGSLRWLHVRGRVTRDEKGEVVALRGTSQDITERHELESRLTEQALHDELTGLPNRRLFEARLTEALAASTGEAATVAVLFIDVDRFKLINDGLGHEAGDELLVCLGKRLQGIMRAGDTVARFGGDEFVVLSQHLCGSASSADDLESVVRRIQQASAEPFTLRGVEMVVTLSIGIALSSLTGTDAGALLRDADAAMYQAKQNGRARHAVFADDMREHAVHRLDVERELRRALGERQLEVYYQPIFDLHNGTVDSLEALVRWRHPTRGLLAPGEFIAVAEETGLVVPLGEWVLEQACRQLNLWQRSAPELLTLGMAVNLSGIQVALPDLTDRIGRILARTGLDGSSLELEITESVLMQDAEETMAILRSLKSLGVRLSVDDFGTGYSSLSYLKRFPVDTLKVDRSFVDGLGVDPEDSAIVQSILALASTLGMITIAEGVETDRQLDALVSLGCAKAQGYHLARPGTAEQIGELLRRRIDSSRVPLPRAEHGRLSV